MARVFLLGLAALLTGCGSAPPLPDAGPVELPRFMGTWYVIANIPTFIEEGAHNAVESYRLSPEGVVETTFTFRAGGFDGPLKRYTPRGFVREGTGNAVWGMQFVWPIEADYRIAWVSPDYSQTLIARERRDYLWIMARQPQIPEEDYRGLVARAKALGYAVENIQKVPQRWGAGS